MILQTTTPKNAQTTKVRSIEMKSGHDASGLELGTWNLELGTWNLELEFCNLLFLSLSQFFIHLSRKAEGCAR